MTSEHHGGFPGLPPEPAAARGLPARRDADGWAAPCPLLLPLRPAALVAEEIAWLAARFPGRVGLGVAAGALPVDFEIMDVTMDDLAARFTAGLEVLAGMLGGTDAGTLADDPAIAACRRAPDPGPERGHGLHRGAARRAARRGLPVRLARRRPIGARELVDAYRDAGGTGPCVLMRRAWVGEPPRERLRRPGRRVPQLLQSTAAHAALGRRRDRRRRRAPSARRRGGCVDVLCTAPAPTR